MEETTNEGLVYIGDTGCRFDRLAAASADDVKIGYINKMGDHPWFVAEVGGAKAAAAEGRRASIRIAGRPVQCRLTVTTFDTMVGDGVKGIAIVVPDKGLGPVIAEKAKAAENPAGGRRRRHLLPGRHAGPLCRHERHNIGARVGENWPSSIRPKAGPARRCASPRSRTARPTPACSATRVPRRPS